MSEQLRELRDMRKRYEVISETKVIGAGNMEMPIEVLDLIEMVNAVRVAKKWYESLLLEAEIMKELRK